MTLDFHSGNLKAEAATSARFSEKGGKQGRLTGQVSKQISYRLLGLLSEREGTWNQWRRSRRKSSTPCLPSRPGLEKKLGPARLGTHPGLVQRQRLLTQHHALLLHTPVLEPNFDLLVAEV